MKATHLYLNRHYANVDFKSLDELGLDVCIQTLAFTTSDMMRLNWLFTDYHPGILVGMDAKRYHAHVLLLLSGQLSSFPDLEPREGYLTIEPCSQFDIGFASKEDHLFYIELIAQYYRPAQSFIALALRQYHKEHSLPFIRWMLNRPWELKDLPYPYLVDLARICCKLTFRASHLFSDDRKEASFLS